MFSFLPFLGVTHREPAEEFNSVVALERLGRLPPAFVIADLVITLWDDDYQQLILAGSEKAGD